MQRRRVLSFALSAFFICFALCGTVSASGILTIDEMDIDPWGDLAEIQDGAELPGPVAPIGVDDPVYALSRSPMAVMSAAATSDTAAEWHIDKTGKQYFGFSTKYTGQWDSMGPVTKDIDSLSVLSSGLIRLASYTNSDKMKSTVAYQAPEEFYVDVYKDVDFSEDNFSYVYVNGNPNLYLEVSNTYGAVLIVPKSIHVLVNDSVYVSDIEPGSNVRQEIPLGSEFPKITKVGFRFYFAVNETQKDTGTVSDVVYYNVLPRIGNLSVTSSDKATGLLSGILAFLQTIYNAIVSLPGNIASAIIEGLRGLFIPSEEDITGIKSQYESLFSQRLGFIYQAASWITDFAQTMLSTLQSGNTYQFTFPGVSVPLPDGTNMVLLQEQQVSLDNGLMDVLRPVLGTIVSFICVVSFINMAHDMVSALISGTSYFEFMRGGKHDDN